MDKAIAIILFLMLLALVVFWNSIIDLKPFYASDFESDEKSTTINNVRPFLNTIGQ